MKLHPSAAHMEYKDLIQQNREMSEPGSIWWQTDCSSARHVRHKLMFKVLGFVCLSFLHLPFEL